MRSDLAWALSQLGPAAELVRATRLNATKHVLVDAVDIDNRGARHRLVIRRYIHPEVRAREPDIASREALTLQLLETAPFRTPRLVAVDPDGAAVGVPTVLITRLPGRAQWAPDSIEKLAELAPQIHRVVAPRRFRRFFRYYRGAALRVPAWSNQPKLWERAFAVAESAEVDWPSARFLHRDHHAGNVLWAYGRVSGVIDWEPACVGPPAVDFAHVRINLAAFVGIAAARRYAKCPGVDVDPVWDVTMACDFGPDDPGPNGRRGREAFVADALSELG